MPEFDFMDVFCGSRSEPFSKQKTIVAIDTILDCETHSHGPKLTNKVGTYSCSLDRKGHGFLQK